MEKAVTSSTKTVDVKPKMVKWFFGLVALPLLPFMMAILVVGVLYPQNLVGLLGDIFSPPQVLFLGIIHCASGLVDSFEIKSHAQNSLLDQCVFYILLIGFLTMTVLYTAFITNKLIILPTQVPEPSPILSQLTMVFIAILTIIFIAANYKIHARLQRIRVELKPEP